MAAEVTHAKVSAIPDDPVAEAAGEILPSDWNDGHVITGVALSSHAHAGEDITSGTVADARVAGTLARDSETTAAVAAEATARDAAITTHAGLSDPHTGYQKESEKGAAGGYASLDGGGTVPDAQLPAALARDTEVTAAVAAEASARDTAIGVAIAALIASAPGALDTLDEIAAALGDDASFAATITTALAGKQATDAELTAIAGLVSAANKLGYFTGSGTASLTDFTAFARTLLDDADAATARTTLGLGTAAVAATGDFDAAGAAAAAQAASQPLDADLTAIAALTSAADKLPYATGAQAWALTTLSSFIRTLLDDADAATARATLGAGTSSVVVGTGVSTQAFGDAAADGASSEGAPRLHKHAMPANPVAKGTSFPGSPADGDLFYRTDLDLLCRYRSSGSRWVTVQLFEANIAMQTAVVPLAASNSFYGLVPNAGGDLWIEEIQAAIQVGATNDASNYWTVSYLRFPSGTAIGAAFDSKLDTAGVATRHTTSVGALSGTSDTAWQISLVKSGSPGNAYLFGATMFYRRVIT